MLEVRIEDGVAVVTLNRPDRLNALSSGLRTALAQAMDRLDADDGVLVIVLTGAGRGFCSGLDLKELTADPPSPGDLDPVLAIERCRKPVIAAVNGVAVTGGFELALACDIVLASTEARFADTHARVGIMPGWRLSQRLSRTIGLSRAKELSLSGAYLDAREACAWGLANRVYPPERLMSAALNLAAQIAGVPAANVRRYKQLIDQGYAMTYGAGVVLEGAVAQLAGEVARAEGLGDKVARVFAHGRDQSGGGR